MHATHVVNHWFKTGWTVTHLTTSDLFFLSSLKRCICSHPTCCVKELVCNKEFTWFRFTVTSLLKYRFAKLPPYSPNKHLQQVESCCLACVFFFFFSPCFWKRWTQRRHACLRFAQALVLFHSFLFAFSNFQTSLSQLMYITETPQSIHWLNFFFFKPQEPK